MDGDSLKLNFEIALEKIDKLTKQNNKLLDEVDRLETELQGTEKIIEPVYASQNRFSNISAEADAAMRRFTAKLRKEFKKNGKSKQGQGESV